MQYFELKSRFQRNGIVTFLDCRKVNINTFPQKRMLVKKQYDIWFDYFKSEDDVADFKGKFRNIIDMTKEAENNQQ